MSIVRIPELIKDTEGVFGVPRKVVKTPAAVIVPNFLSPTTCEWLVANLTPDSDIVIAEDNAHSGKGDEKIEANNFVLNPNTTYSFHANLIKKIRGVNDKYYGYENLYASWQFPCYISEYWKGCFRSFHFDGGFIDPTNQSFHNKEQESFFHNRALTCVVQLSKDDEYTGGDLNFMRYLNVDHPKKRQQGTAIIFPSTQWHEVTKVKSGLRYSLSLFLYSDGKKHIR